MGWLGCVAAILTTAAFVPQAIKTIRSRDTGGVSQGMYLAFTTFSAVGGGFASLAPWRTDAKPPPPRLGVRPQPHLRGGLLVTHRH